MPTFRPEQLREVAVRLLTGIGAVGQEADIVADHLVEANLAGHDSHGLIRIPQYYAHAREGRLALGQQIETLRESSTTALLDGKNTWGPVVAARAVELGMQKAREHGMAAIGVRRCYHVGRVGVYPRQAALEGFVAKMWCAVHGVARMAPWGGVDARFGTNPIAISLPTRGEPILIDLTTTVVAEGKVRVAKNKGISVPEGWLLDEHGQPTTNPADLYEGGTILPFGGAVGHKGYGLALVDDVLGGILTGAGCGVMPGVAVGNGLFLEIVDPTTFVDHSDYLDRIDAYTAYLKSSATKPGVAEILLPGEPETRITQQRRADGIAIDDATWGQIQAVAGELGVSLEAPA